MFSVGIVGLPNVGKSTLFNALAKADVLVSDRPFCTVEPNVRRVAVPDERLDRVAAMFGQETRVPTTIEFVDIAGLVKGASEGKGLGNQFLARIREVDAILHVVRGFSSASVVHVEGEVDAVRDIEIVNLELCLADLGTVERRLAEERRKAKAGDRKLVRGVEILEALESRLGEGEPAGRPEELAEEERQVVAELFLLTTKPALYALNVSDSPDEQEVGRAREWLGARGAPYILIPAQLEADLAGLDDDEAEEFRTELGVKEGALAQVIVKSYEILDLITFFTAVGKEARAWTLQRGSTAQGAAAQIHTDMAERFIKAEVVPFSVLDEAGSWAEAKDKGLVRTEGRDHVVQDGDVLHIRFGG